MNVQIVVRVDGRDVAEILESVETLDALDLEVHVERIKRRAGRAMLEVGLTQLGPPQANHQPNAHGSRCPIAIRVDAGPEADFRRQRVLRNTTQFSCDGVMYGTNETEPAPLHREEKRQVWCQMRVGVVAWQDEHDKWHKQMIWGKRTTTSRSEPCCMNWTAAVAITRRMRSSSQPMEPTAAGGCFDTALKRNPTATSPTIEAKPPRGPQTGSTSPGHLGRLAIPSKGQ